MSSRPTDVSIEVGDRAPGFMLPNHHGEAVSLADLGTHRGVAVVFFPFSFSGICTRELAELQEVAEVIAAADVRLLAISCDPMYTLRAFCDAEGLTYDLLSDFWPHGAVARSYGVLDEERGCALRGTFVLDAAGTVRWKVLNQLPDARSTAELRAAIAELAV